MTLPGEVLAGDGLASGAVMAAMALVSVGLWTLRVTLAARGRKLAAAAAAAVEAVVFAVVFSSLAASLDAPARLLGYAVGVAGGTMLGLYLDERGAHGKSEIQVVVHGRDGHAAETLRGLGWPATSFVAEGPDGPVTVLFLAAEDTQVPQIEDVLRRSAPGGFWAVQPLRHLHPSLVPASAPLSPGARFSPLPGHRRPSLRIHHIPTHPKEIHHDHDRADHDPTAPAPHAA